MVSSGDDDVRFGPTSGVVSGWLGVVLCAGVAVLALVSGADRGSFRIVLCAAAAGVLVWCFLLRPRIVVRAPAELVLRNAVSSWVLPLAAVQAVTVRAITKVEAGGRRYDALAVGRSMRPRRAGSAHPHDAVEEADLVVQVLLAEADQARKLGTGTGSPRRVWAVPELTALAVLALAVLLLSL